MHEGPIGLQSPNFVHDTFLKKKNQKRHVWRAKKVWITELNLIIGDSIPGKQKYIIKSSPHVPLCRHNFLVIIPASYYFFSLFSFGHLGSLSTSLNARRVQLRLNRTFFCPRGPLADFSVLSKGEKMHLITTASLFPFPYSSFLLKKKGPEQ